MPQKKSRERGRAWFNWPLVVGLIVNFAVWLAAGAWLVWRRR